VFNFLTPLGAAGAAGIRYCSEIVLPLAGSILSTALITRAAVMVISWSSSATRGSELC